MDQRQYQARRPTDEQVRDFLQMRREGESARNGARDERSLRREGDARTIARPGEVDRRLQDAERNVRDRREFEDRVTGRDRDREL